MLTNSQITAAIDKFKGTTDIIEVINRFKSTGILSTTFANSLIDTVYADISESTEVSTFFDELDQLLLDLNKNYNSLNLLNEQLNNEYLNTSSAIRKAELKSLLDQNETQLTSLSQTGINLRKSINTYKSAFLADSSEVKNDPNFFNSFNVSASTINDLSSLVFTSYSVLSQSTAFEATLEDEVPVIVNEPDDIRKATYLPNQVWVVPTEQTMDTYGIYTGFSLATSNTFDASIGNNFGVASLITETDKMYTFHYKELDSHPTYSGLKSGLKFYIMDSVDQSSGNTVELSYGNTVVVSPSQLRSLALEKRFPTGALANEPGFYNLSGMNSVLSFDTATLIDEVSEITNAANANSNTFSTEVVVYSHTFDYTANTTSYLIYDTLTDPNVNSIRDVSQNNVLSFAHTLVNYVDTYGIYLDFGDGVEYQYSDVNEPASLGESFAIESLYNGYQLRIPDFVSSASDIKTTYATSNTATLIVKTKPTTENIAIHSRFRSYYTNSPFSSSANYTTLPTAEITKYGGSVLEGLTTPEPNMYDPLPDYDYVLKFLELTGQERTHNGENTFYLLSAREQSTIMGLNQAYRNGFKISYPATIEIYEQSSNTGFLDFAYNTPVVELQMINNMPVPVYEKSFTLNADNVQERITGYSITPVFSGTIFDYGFNYLNAGIVGIPSQQNVLDSVMPYYDAYLTVYDNNLKETRVPILNQTANTATANGFVFDYSSGANLIQNIRNPEYDTLLQNGIKAKVSVVQKKGHRKYFDKTIELTSAIKSGGDYNVQSISLEEYKNQILPYLEVNGTNGYFQRRFHSGVFILEDEVNNEVAYARVIDDTWESSSVGNPNNGYYYEGGRFIVNSYTSNFGVKFEYVTNDFQRVFANATKLRVVLYENVNPTLAFDQSVTSSQVVIPSSQYFLIEFPNAPMNPLKYTSSPAPTIPGYNGADIFLSKYYSFGPGYKAELEIYNPIYGSKKYYPLNRDDLTTNLKAGIWLDTANKLKVLAGTDPNLYSYIVNAQSVRLRVYQYYGR